MLDFKNFEVVRDRVLLDFPDFCLESGKTVAILGKNGCGKSSFFESFFDHSLFQGTMNIEDENIKNESKNSVFKKISFINNKFSFAPNLRCDELLRLGRFIHTSYLDRLSEEDQTIIDTYVKQLDLAPYLNRNFTSLSDGEKQRVVLAKALIQETSILLLDEPTAFLDYTAKMEVFALLKRIAIENNRLILFSTHDIQLALEFADEFLLVSKNTELVKLLKEKPSLNEIVAFSF